MKIDRKLRGAVIGAGFMGQTHLQAYSNLEHVSIEAIIDPSANQAEELAKTHGIRSFASLQEAVAVISLDFVDICAPTPFHVQLIESAFHHNCHAIVEKPVSAVKEDLQKIKTLASQSDRRLMVAQVCRFMGVYLYAKQTVESGRLGKALAFSAKRYIDLPSWSVDNWINDKKLSGGTLVDLSIHDIDISNWLFGKPIRLNASEVTKIPGGPAHLMETLEYCQGTVSHIEGSHLLPQSYPLSYEYQLLLEEGLISGGVGDSEVFLKEFSQGAWNHIDPNGVVRWEDPYTEELDHFTKALLSGEDFRISLEDAFDSVLTALSLQKSIDIGNRVVLETL